MRRSSKSLSHISLAQGASWYPCALVLAAVIALSTPAGAQDVNWGGQVRPRFEFRDTVSTGTSDFTSMRVRGELGAALGGGVSVFIQLQDVRIWGEESSTLMDFRAEHFNLHQGYLELQSNGSTIFSGRAGRQILSYGGERLIGAVDWAQQGRAFDGVRLRADANAARVDLFGARLANASAPAITEDAYLLGTYGSLQAVGPGVIDVYAIYNRAVGETETNQITFGARWGINRRDFAFRGEGTYQMGKRTDVDVAAFMVGARLSGFFVNGLASVTLWYDYLSGDDDSSDGTVRVFDTLFATNHKYYGLADLFLNIPVQTAGRGLQDFAVKSTYVPYKDVSIALDIHSFHLAKGTGLTTGHLGEEADLHAAYRYNQHFRVVGGVSYVFAAEGLSQIGRSSDNILWTYLMLDAAF